VIGKTILQYEIVEQLGEVPKSPASVSQRVAVILRIPPFFCGSGKEKFA